MRVLITAGGTGGHIYPAISIINKIKELDKTATFLYIGTIDRMEKDIIPKLNIEYIGIKMCGLCKNPIKLVKFISNLFSGINKCKKIIKSYKPDIVIGVGGYVTAPVIVAASKTGIPCLLHEQNCVPGKANKFLSKYVDVVCVSMESTLQYFTNTKAVYTGNPRSEDILAYKIGNKEDYKLIKKKKLVLITTGSLGASTINSEIFKSLKNIKDKDYEVLIVTGTESYEEAKKIKTPHNVKVVPYIEDMGGVLKFTDLIVSRAGATTISEIMALGIPSILIPSPYVANNHQYLNAKYLYDNKACYMIEEKDFNAEILIKQIDKILTNKVEYEMLQKNSKHMGITNSSTKIYEEIMKLTNKGE